MSILTIGTSPTLILNPNEKRKKLAIQMQSTNVDAANTGRVHIGFDFQPNATVGHPSQGEILIQGSGIEEPVTGITLDKKYKQAIWATASASNQSITIEEEITE